MSYKQILQGGYSRPGGEPEAFGAWGCFANFENGNPFWPWPGMTASVPPGPLSLAMTPKTLIRRASVDPGRELNGRSQQFHLFGDVDVTGPVGPSSRASAF